MRFRKNLDFSTYRGNFQQLSNQTKKRIFWHVLDVFSVLSDRIKSIPFHERSASHGTTLEYHQQGNRSNLKIHFLMAQSDFQGPTPVGRKVQIFPKTHFFTYLYPYTPKFWSPIIQNSLFIFMTCPNTYEYLYSISTDIHIYLMIGEVLFMKHRVME